MVSYINIVELVSGGTGAAGIVPQFFKIMPSNLDGFYNLYSQIENIILYGPYDMDL